MIKTLKKLIHSGLINFADFIARKAPIPRLYEKKEWNKYNSKEKCWILYKHHFHMIGIGNGELDNVLFFMRGEFLTQVGIFGLIALNLGLPLWGYFIYPVFFFFYKYVQWWVGNQIDKRDLVAIDSEITSKRSMALREIRKKANNEPFRKNL